MKILVACEYSGVVRDAFSKFGHDAWSCDILPTESPGQHIQGDVLPLLDLDWDMVIAFPPCTHLAVSGARYFEQKRKDGRQQKGIDFFMAFPNSRIPRKAIENPVGIMSTVWRKPDQIIQPYQYGHDASKATCLWLEFLPLLQPTNFVDPRIIVKNGKEYKRWSNQTDSGQNRLTPRSDRAKLRSKTYQGVADAMAEQWGNL